MELGFAALAYWAVKLLLRSRPARSFIHEALPPVTDTDRLTVRYADPFALLRDLRAMGATNALAERRRRPLRRETLMRMAEIYTDRFAEPDGRIRATFEIVWLSGWAPHESQQQPLRPGSASRRLAEALGTVEQPLKRE